MLCIDINNVSAVLARLFLWLISASNDKVISGTTGIWYAGKHFPDSSADGKAPWSHPYQIRVLAVFHGMGKIVIGCIASVADIDSHGAAGCAEQPQAISWYFPWKRSKFSFRLKAGSRHLNARPWVSGTAYKKPLWKGLCHGQNMCRFSHGCILPLWWGTWGRAA